MAFMFCVDTRVIAICNALSTMYMIKDAENYKIVTGNGM
jgi:hypothetical protein